MDDRFLNGESKSIATIPMLKICTPPPDMYNMNACMGSDLTGEMAKSHARFCFSASCESSAAAAASAAEDLLSVLVYNNTELRINDLTCSPHCDTDGHIAPLKPPRNLADEEACSIFTM
jgi:hypothetical protein